MNKTFNIFLNNKHATIPIVVLFANKKFITIRLAVGEIIIVLSIEKTDKYNF